MFIFVPWFLYTFDFSPFHCIVLYASFVSQSSLKFNSISGSSRMTWKERKELENKKIVSLGGKVKTFLSVFISLLF